MASQATTSNKPLLRESTIDVEKGLCSDPQPQQNCCTWKNILTLIIILFFEIQDKANSFIIINLHSLIKEEFQLTKQQYFIMQIAYISAFLLLVIPFGILADQHNRKNMLCGGITLKFIATLAGSFVPLQNPTLFVVIRVLFSIADATYSSTSSSLIPDLVPKKKHVFLLALSHMCSPIGSTLGFIISYKMKTVMGLNWRWNLRVPAGFCLFTLLVVIIFMKEPERKKPLKPLTTACKCSNLKELFKTRSILFAFAGSTVVTLICKGPSVWAKHYVERVRISLDKGKECHVFICQLEDSLIANIFSAVAFTLGAIVGSTISKFCQKMNPRAEPIVCAACLVISAPLLVASLYCFQNNPLIGYIFLVIIEMLMNTVMVITSNIRTTP
ncbi:protein spinster homolog 1-like [Pyxicephalus adspersus]|uniref:protein spinster homolog 1-like n=1 Tax=Pyxicephalus adspersus TaxID=30357 RepID=UPI003B5B67BB